jgi:hypothetical protein
LKFLISPESLFLGLPIEIEGLCKVYPLTFDEIAAEDLGFGKYHFYVNLFTMAESDIMAMMSQKGIQLPEDFSTFDYLMLMSLTDSNFFLDLKKAFKTFFKEEVMMLPEKKLVVIGSPVEKRVLTKEAFTIMAEIISAQNCLPKREAPPKDETPMQRKFRLKREERERVKAKSKKGDQIDLADMLSSLCVSGIGITPFNMGKLTVYQAKEMLERIQAKEMYDLENRMLIAGADSKKIKPKHWIRKLH